MNNLSDNALTLPQVLLNTVRRFPHHTALGWRNGKQWQTINYERLLAKISQVTQAFHLLGLRSGDRVAILSENRPEWAWVDFALQFLGIINVPIYHTQSSQQIDQLLNHCGARVLIVSGGELLKKIDVTTSVIKNLEYIIHFDRILDPPRFKKLLSLKTIMQAHPPLAVNALVELSAEVKPEQCASIIYTSGTTGTAKGVMLSHSNFCANIQANIHALPINDKDRVLSFLPLSHVFERTCGYYTIIAIGASIFYARALETVMEDMSEVKPTSVIAVPRLFEKIHAGILEKVEAAGKRKVFDWAIAVGKAKQQLNPSLLTNIQYRLAGRLVFNKLKQRTGGRLRFFVSGGAPLPKHLGEFFKYAGIDIVEGYGLTETAPVICCNRLGKIRFGTIGQPLCNIEVKVAEDGELQAKGPSIMKGYYNNPSATTEAFTSDGWFKTGDLACIDSDGYVSITGRKKQIIVLSNGKKISPEPIENALAGSRFIDQVILYGENCNYVIAIVVPAYNYLQNQALQSGLTQTTIADLLNDPTVQRWYLEEITHIADNFARFEQPKRILLRAKLFNIEEGTLTPSLKIVRNKVYTLLEKDIQALYKQENQDVRVASL